MEATETFAAGGEQVTVAVQIDTGTSNPISGNVSGMLGDAHIVGDLNLTGDVFSEGVLTSIDTFHIQGNGFSWFFQNGGRADLHGKFKAPWGPWGTDTTGWVAGDRLAITPTKLNVFVPSELAWSNWGVARPTNSPDVTLVDGSVAKPEVVNLSQTIVIENLARGFHFHDSAGVQTLSDVKFLNCGTSGVLGSYPIHFHMLGDSSRGSLLERVVVEGGRNHAFVPHASHGITQRGCVAYNTKGFAYWWDPPIMGQTPRDTSNDTNDLAWDNCLVLGVTAFAGDPGNTKLAGFFLGSGTNLSCVGSVAVGVAGNANSGSRNRSGFHWPENANLEAWDFRNCVGHNNAENAVFTWQNTDEPHFVEDSVFYRNGYAAINHGAYSNQYRYSRLVISESGLAVVQHAKTGENDPVPLIFEDIMTDGDLMIPSHNSQSMAATVHRRCTYPKVVYLAEGANGSFNRYEDCGLVPSDFVLTSIAAASIIEVFEAGVLTHRWQSGVWT